MEEENIQNDDNIDNQNNNENGNNIENENNIQNDNNVENDNNIQNDNNINNENNIQNDNNVENENNVDNENNIQNDNNIQNENQEINNDNHIQQNLENNNNNAEENQNQNIIDNNNGNLNQNNNPENNQINNNQFNNVFGNVPPHLIPQNLNDNNQENNNNIINNNINQENENTVEIIKTKIKELREKYNFSIQFYDTMNKILKNLQDSTYEKLTNSINEYLNYFSFFKNSSEMYSKFAEQIKISNSSIMSKENVSKLNDDFLLGVMQKTQNLLFQNLSQISTGLKQKIISKGPLSKLQENINKIDNIKKTNINKLKEIEEQKKTLTKKYQKNEKLFDSYLPDPNANNANNRNRHPRPPLVDSPDFVYIIEKLMELITKLILDINLYIIDTKDCFYKINQIFVEMNNLLRDSVLIYIQESKSIFNIDVTKNFDEIETYYKKLENKNEDQLFKLSKIFNTNQSQNNIYSLLQHYYTLLSNSGTVKKELLADKNKFSINQHDNILLFFEWLISVSPQPSNIVTDDLIIKKVKIKRDPGLFKSWRDTIMVFTKQKHLLLYDAPQKVENFVKIYELDKINFRKKIDNKRPYLFELIVNRKGKVMDFKGTYLFDGLNEEKINEIHPIILRAYNN